jgi:hypothetical protein
MSDPVFRPANLVYEGKIKGLKKQGKDVTAHKPPIDERDMARFYESGVLCNNNPVALQRKVFLEISFHFGRRGREGWRGMTRESFCIKKDAEGREYLTMSYNEHDKNHADAENKIQCMYANPESDLCPLKSYKLYLEKLNPHCNAFLQRPLPNYHGRQVWYANAPLGVNTIATMMKGISQDAGASRIYTNHSIKASTATVLKKAGYAPQDIMAVTGHRNVASLESYAQGPGQDDRAKMSNELAMFGKAANSSVDIVTSQSGCTATLSTGSRSLSVDNNIGSIFSGAHFTGNVTINVQINK